jgi:hypothetical protein
MVTIGGKLNRVPRYCRVAMLRGRKTVRAQSAILDKSKPMPSLVFNHNRVFSTDVSVEKTRLARASAQVLPKPARTEVGYKSRSVIAPRLAVETNFMYLASRPRV